MTSAEYSRLREATKAMAVSLAHTHDGEWMATIKTQATFGERVVALEVDGFGATPEKATVASMKQLRWQLRDVRPLSEVRS